MTADPSWSGAPPRLDPRLLDEASRRYRPAGRFAYHFARGKLSHDPAFGAIVHSGWIKPNCRVLDLGCGQGLLAAVLLAAGRGCRFRGIELMPRDAQRAKTALGKSAQIVCGDIRQEDFGDTDVVVILDVLHYIDFVGQDHVLHRAHHALAAGGLLLLRVGDIAAGWPFRLSNWVDHAVTFTRGNPLPRLHYRTLAEWRQALERLGFEVTVIPLSHGTPFANVLLKARLPDP